MTKYGVRMTYDIGTVVEVEAAELEIVTDGDSAPAYVQFTDEDDEIVALFPFVIIISIIKQP